MGNRTTRLVPGVMLLLGLGAPAIPGVASLNAQAAAYFKALSIPPRTVGTCLEPGQDEHPVPRQRTIRLVISSREFAARREMSLVHDSLGVARGFSEIVDVFLAPSSSTGEAVIAALHPGGRTAGSRHATSLSMRIVPSPDSALPRLVPDSARSTSRETPLTTAEQRKVRALAAWLARRCRA